MRFYAFVVLTYEPSLECVPSEHTALSILLDSSLEKEIRHLNSLLSRCISAESRGNI